MGDSKESWLNEVKDHRVLVDGHRYWIMRMNSADAEARGISEGDLIRAFNDRGSVILAAQVTERLPSGTVHSYESCADYLPTGTPGESPDRAGCVNVLTSKRFMTPTSHAQANNSCLVQVEKWARKEIVLEESVNKPSREPGEKTIVRDISWCGVAAGANASMVDVKDGKMIRIRPARYYEQYTKEEVKPWVMNARGKTFEPSDKSLAPPLSLAYKKRVYSPARIRFPMKRVDFDPKGERNIQNRGVSKYVRVSWDEALDIIVGEMQRIKDTYGPTAILYQCDQHGENKVVHGPHGCGRKLLKLFGGFTLQMRNPDSWEGWWWGAKHVWGCEPVGQQMPQKNLLYDISKNADLLLFWGCDQETTPWGWQGQLPSRLSYWWTELGIKQIYIAPDLNYAAAVHADKWIPILPNTDAALYLAICYQWFRDGTYDKEYLKTHAYGVDKFEDYVMGREDGEPKTPEWAAPITGVPSRIIKALAKDWASKRTTVCIGNGGPGIRGPYSTEPARLQVLCLAMQGLGRPGCNQAKMIEWGLFDNPEQQSPADAPGLHRLEHRLHRWSSRLAQPPLVHPQDPRTQGHPRRQVRLVWLRERSSPTARTSSSTTSTRPTAAPRST